MATRPPNRFGISAWGRSTECLNWLLVSSVVLCISRPYHTTELCPYSSISCARPMFTFRGTLCLPSSLLTTTAPSVW